MSEFLDLLYHKLDKAPGRFSSLCFMARMPVDTLDISAGDVRMMSGSLSVRWRITDV